MTLEQLQMCRNIIYSKERVTFISSVVDQLWECHLCEGIHCSQPGDNCMCDMMPQSWASGWHQSSCPVPQARLSGCAILAAKAGHLLVS